MTNPVKITVTVQNAILTIGEIEIMRKSLKADLETCELLMSEGSDFKMKRYVHKKRRITADILRKLKYQQRDLQRQITKQGLFNAYNIQS